MLACSLNSLQNRLLKRHHSETAASTEQHGENHKSGTMTISSQLAAAGAALAAGEATHHVQAGHTDLQDTTQTSVTEYLSCHITTRSSMQSLRSSSAPPLQVSFRPTSFVKRYFSTV